MFHLRALRRLTVGLNGRGPFTEAELETARKNCSTIIEKMQKLEESNGYEGGIRQFGLYERHGISISLSGQVSHSEYLRSVLAHIVSEDIPHFVSNVELLCTALPPIYVGVTIDQTLQQRYSQHKRNHANQVSGTFGQRLARLGFEWSDVVFSCAPQPGVSDAAIRAIESYLQFFARPSLGRS